MSPVLFRKMFASGHSAFFFHDKFSVRQFLSILLNHQIYVCFFEFYIILICPSLIPVKSELQLVKFRQISVISNFGGILFDYFRVVLVKEIYRIIK